MIPGIRRPTHRGKQVCWFLSASIILNFTSLRFWFWHQRQSFVPTTQVINSGWLPEGNKTTERYIDIAHNYVNTNVTNTITITQDDKTAAATTATTATTSLAAATATPGTALVPAVKLMRKKRAQYLLVDTIWEQLACGARNVLDYLQLANLLNRTAVLPFYTTTRPSSFTSFLGPPKYEGHAFLEVFSNSSVIKLQRAMPGLHLETSSYVGHELRSKCIWIQIDFKDDSIGATGTQPTWVGGPSGFVNLPRNFNVNPLELNKILGTHEVFCIKEFHGFSSSETARSNWNNYIRPNCERGILPCLDLGEKLMANSLLSTERSFFAITLRVESIIMKLQKRKAQERDWNLCQEKIIWIIVQISKMMGPNKVLLFHDIARSVSFNRLVNKASSYDSRQLRTLLEMIPNVTSSTCPNDPAIPCAPIHLELAARANAMVSIGGSGYHGEMRNNVKKRGKTAFFIPDVCSEDEQFQLYTTCTGVCDALKQAGYLKNNTEPTHVCETFSAKFLPEFLKSHIPT